MPWGWGLFLSGLAKLLAEQGFVLICRERCRSKAGEDTRAPKDVPVGTPVLFQVPDKNGHTLPWDRVEHSRQHITMHL